MSCYTYSSPFDVLGTHTEREMEAAGKKLVLVVVAFITAVALAVILLVGVVSNESVPQSIEGATTEETSLLEEGQVGRWTRQLTSFEAYVASVLQRWCTNRGSIVMENTDCNRYNPCEGNNSICLWGKCCCNVQVCNCSSATCRAVPEAVTHCEDDGKCRKECSLQFFLRGVEITSFCETSTREEVEDYVESSLCARNCYEGVKPCERDPCIGASYATCENHCDGYCEAKYILRGVDITGFCYLDTTYIESYVELIQKSRAVTDTPTDTEDGDQGGSGSGSDRNA